MSAPNAGAMRAARKITHAYDGHGDYIPAPELEKYINGNAKVIEDEIGLPKLIEAAKAIDAEMTRAALNQQRPRLSVLSKWMLELSAAIARAEGKS